MSYDVLIIGGGPAGLSAAVNARARGKTALVVSNPMTESALWKAEQVDNHLGQPHMTGRAMLEQFHSHALEAGAEIREGKVLTAMSMGDEWYVTIGSDMEQASALVLAAGVSRGKKFPGEAEFLGRGVSYCATCDGMLYRGKKVAVAGYTDTAKREAEFLSGIGCEVTYLDKPRDLTVTGGDKVAAVTADGADYAVDALFLLRPTVAPTDLFPGLELENGYVAVNRKMETNLPGLFAAGDCTGGPLQVSKAVGEGLVAGQSAAIYAGKIAAAKKK